MITSTEMGWLGSMDGRDGNHAAYDSEDNDDENRESCILSQENLITQLPYQSLRANSPRQPLATKPKFNDNDNALAQQLLARSFDSFVQQSIMVPECPTPRGAPDADSSNESPAMKSSCNNDVTRASRRPEVVTTRGLTTDLPITTSQRSHDSAEQMHSRGVGTPQLSVENHFSTAEAREGHMKSIGKPRKNDLEKSESGASKLQCSLDLSNQITTAESSLWRRRTARGRYVPRFAKMIAKKQQAILDQPEDGWQPPYVGRPFRSGDVPIQLLSLMTKFADDTAEAAANLQKETWVSGQISKEDSEEHLTLEPAESAPAAHHLPSPAMQSSPPSTQLSWSSSEYDTQRRPLRTCRELPPDSSPLKSGIVATDSDRETRHNNGSNVNGLMSSVTFADEQGDRCPEQDSNSEDEDKDGASISDIDSDGRQSKAISLKRWPSTDINNADEVKQGSNSKLGPIPVKSSADSFKVVQVSRTPHLRKAYSDIIQVSGEILTMPETTLMKSRPPHLRNLPKTVPPSSLIIPATAFVPGSTDPLALLKSSPPSLPRSTHSESDIFERETSEDESIHRGGPEAEHDEVLSTGYSRSKNLPFASKEDLHSQPEKLSLKDPPCGTPSVVTSIQDLGAYSPNQSPVRSVVGMRPADDYQILVPDSMVLHGSKRKHAELESENNIKRRMLLQTQSKAKATSSDPAFQAWEDRYRQLRRDFCANLAAEASKTRSSEVDTSPAIDDSASTDSKQRQVSSQSSVSAVRPLLSTPITKVPNYHAAMNVSDKHVPARCSSLKLQGGPEESSDLFHRFEATYPHYRGKKRHFDEACALLQRLGDSAQHPSLWDDFVFRYYNEYIQEHLPEVQKMGMNAIPYEKFYRDFVEEPHFLSKVIKRTKIEIFSDRTSVLHSDSHRKAASTKREAPSLSFNRFMDVESPISNAMEPVQPQPTYLFKAEDTKVDLNSTMKAASTPSHGMKHLQDLSVKMWLERASGAESPELGTPEIAEELAQIPPTDIGAPASSPVRLLQPRPRHRKEDPVFDKATSARGIARRNANKSPARRAPDTPFSKLSKEFADLDRMRWVVNSEVQRMIDIFTWRK